MKVEHINTKNMIFVDSLDLEITGFTMLGFQVYMVLLGAAST